MRFHFYPTLVLRLPQRPQHDLEEINKVVNLDEQVREAIFIASPELVKIAGKSHAAALKYKMAWHKYLSRMCTRCTPFGLFAGCDLVSWADRTEIVKDKKINRRTRLDYQCWHMIKGRILDDNGLFPYLKVKTNNSLYRVGNEYRFIDPILVEDKLRYHISSSPENEILTLLLSFLGKSFHAVSDAVDLLEEKGIERTVSTDYLKQMLQNNIIVSEFERSESSDKQLQRCQFFLKSLEGIATVSKWLKILSIIQDELHKIDSCKESGIEKYNTLLNFIGDQFEIKTNVLQVDHLFSSQRALLAKRNQQYLRKAIKVLSQINTVPVTNQTLEEFKCRFFARFETREVSLLIALDGETGIEYMPIASVSDLFLHNLSLSADYTVNDPTPKTNKNLSYIIKLIEQSVEEKQTVLLLTDEHLTRLEDIPWEPAGSSYCVFRMVDSDNLLIETVAGSSGVNLFSRFMYMSPAFENMVRDITWMEQKYAAKKIFAEVIHQPEIRSVNIFNNEHTRAYTLPYFSECADGQSHAIDLADIMISISNNEIVLRSKSLNAQVIPKVSNAYNYTRNSSPLFRFLGDLQYNYAPSDLNFDIRKLIPHKTHYPRIQYKNLIFSPEMWIVGHEAINSDLKLFSTGELKAFLAKRGVKGKFNIIEGDNELYTDTSKDISLEILRSILIKKGSALLVEYLFTDRNQVVKNTENKSFTNQFITVLVNSNQEKVSHKLLTSPISNTYLKRNFIPGSEWIYYKIYCSPLKAEKILVEILYPLLAKMIKTKEIQGFFFIRYADPEHHIRLRIKVSSSDIIGGVIAKIADMLGDRTLEEYISAVLLDTYKREVERYGYTIAYSEHLFCIDSLAIIKCLSDSIIRDSTDHRIAIGLRMAFDCLEACGMPLADRILLVSNVKRSLKKDLQISEEALKPIRLLFEDNSLLFNTWMREGLPADPTLHLTKRKRQFTTAFNHIQKDPEIVLANIVASHIHMSINRLFIQSQKTYEFLIYSYLERYLQKISAS